jgi:ABC-type multidrug transport system ATPase subunit
VLLAGALAPDPDVLVLDEPTEGLDVRSRDALLGVVARAVERGLCAVIISHAADDLVRACDHVAWLHPSLEPDQPAQVELISTGELLQRVRGAEGASR